MKKNISMNDQVSEINKYKNEDTNIMIGSVSYNDLFKRYKQARIDSEENNDSSDTDSMKIWNETLSKSLLVCAPKVLNTDGSSSDSGEYHIVVFAPDGRPVQITPGFSKLSEYFVIENDNEEKIDDLHKFNYKKLSINFEKLQNKLLEDTTFIDRLRNKLYPSS